MKTQSFKWTQVLSTFMTVALTFSALGVSPAHAAGIRYSMPGGTGDCSSWANACTLQTALTGATSGDEIWVAAGIYKPTTGAERAATFQLKSGVAVYGGFAGTETARDQRDPAINVTTLSGDLNGDDLGFNNNSENVYHVLIGADGATLDGFTVTAGNANGASPNNGGGGLYNPSSNSPTLANLSFNGNSAFEGGGMYNASYCSPTLTNVVFNGNRALNYGGGMDNIFTSSPTLTNVTFSGNSAINRGGGMANWSHSNPKLTNVIFSDNWATNFGGGIYNISSSPVLTNVTFNYNSALDYGGGIYNNSSSPILTNITFSNNSAYYGGGGMENNLSSKPTLTNVTFSSNSAGQGGGMYNINSSNPQIFDTIFWGNTAPTGGAQIYNQASLPGISDSVIQGGCPASSTCANIFTADPRLGTLGDYGGFTPVIPLLAGSSAINTGNDLTCANTDQRGLTRPQGAHCDIGAFEFEINYTGVYYVKPVASGTGNCQSWANACTLETALATTVNGDEIWVAAGIHKPTTGTNRSASFWLDGGVAVYGGFAGTETIRNERDPATNMTILSGDIDNNDSQTPIITDLNTVSGNETNSYHVVTGANYATLDGFTITAGNDNNNYPNNGGGGMLNYSSSPLLVNITFIGNQAGEGGNGGGMHNTVGSHPTLTDVTFSGNSTWLFGGGMSNTFGSSPVLTNVTFTDNFAAGGGGMYNGNSDPTLTNVSFSSNSAALGGGMRNDSSNPTLTNVTFTGNSGGGGGGMANVNSTPTLTNVTFSGNTVQGAGNGGGGMYNSSSSPWMTNVTFTGNSADYGGGMFNVDYYLAGVASSPQIHNTIFWGNTAPNGAQVFNDPTKGHPSLSYSIVQGGCPAGSNCTNLITTNPMLGALGNYGGFTQTIPLLTGSSAVNAGNDLVCPATDQRGVARPQGAHCDIGAFEQITVNIQVSIAGANQGNYDLPSGGSTRESYASVNAGPVKVTSTGGAPILAAQRILYTGLGTAPTSFVEMMGLPDSQLDKIYWFPWYKNDGIVDTQFRIGNVSGSTATVHIYVAGVEVTGSPFTLTTSGAGQSQRLSFALNDGPVKVVSDQNIVATERLIYFNSGDPASFSEMMGLPNSQLSTTYWLPWYKNDGIVDTQLRIGNVSGSTATVHIYIAGVEVTGSPFTLTTSGTGQSQRLSFPVNDGPVKIVSDVNIVAAQRLIYSESGLPTSFVETMGLPDSQLSTTQWFPWYKNDGIVDTQLRIGNVSGAAASVHVYIGTTEMAGSPFALTATGAGQSLRLSFTENNGPVKIVSDQNIVTSERLIYFLSGVPVSFSEMMGTSDSLLSPTWWLPWYKNVGEIDTQLRFGVP